MKKIKTAMLFTALCAASLPLLFAGSKAPAYDYLSELVSGTLYEIALPLPGPVGDEDRYEKPPCVPSQAILPGNGFFPRVSDERRERAINDLLSRIAVCRSMPYRNDGNVHSKPHKGLPRKPAGYYLEYTLVVPGRPTGSKEEPVTIGGETYMAGPVNSIRGAERILIGGGREVYYTPDHYSTFIRLSILR